MTSSRASSEQTWIIEPKQSFIGYYLIYALGILQVFACGALVYYENSLRGYLLAALLGNLALLFLAVARLLGLAKGGVSFEPSTRDWLIHGLGSTDSLRIPASQVLGLAVERRTEYWGRSPEPVLVSSIHLVTREGIRIMLLQMSSLQDAQERAEWIRDATGVAPIREGGVVWDEPARVMPAASGLKLQVDANGFSASIRTGVAAPLAVALLLAALFCLVSGSLLLAGISVTGIVGALFGPLLLFLGLALAAFLLVRRFGWQQLNVRGGELSSLHRLGRFKWSPQTLQPQPSNCMVRLATRGVHGQHIEILQGEKMAILGAGSSTRSLLPPAQLLQLALLVFGHIRTSLPEPSEPRETP